ncbi:Regulatory protein soxS [Solibacillus isronensis B3W22]|uniref:Regulatory protein soxS n=1 Tax=Solibacillus isronensis B3W22 TaxID=1224748 RepID=K1L1D7_9BACL|nr:AraC family transcriptional regulator [Solibacillus isronensis]AMO85476.1 AraC family transcriptional regulator [Solibacillus silvestris]EKB44488.1 Regulatory protein soxS [Solibacillus isronensis B3W22]
MDTVETLQGILEFIDENITENISPDILAAQAGYSTWHFSRVFQWGTGYSVMTYVRNRRLAFAAHELSSGKRILDISVEYGFETHSGFSKAFRRYYGCSPGTYRLHAHCGRPFPPSLTCTYKYFIGGIVMEPKFVTLSAIKLAGYAIKTTSTGGENSTAIPAFWDDYMSGGKMEKLHSENFIKKHDEYGVCFPEDPTTGEFEYVIGVEPKAGAKIADEYHICEVPPATYAVFSTPPSDAKNFVAAIQGTWNYIFNEWFPKSGFEYAPGCNDFELYDDRCMLDEGKICDIYIPVVKSQK